MMLLISLIAIALNVPSTAVCQANYMGQNISDVPTHISAIATFSETNISYLNYGYRGHAIISYRPNGKFISSIFYIGGEIFAYPMPDNQGITIVTLQLGYPWELKWLPIKNKLMNLLRA